MAAMKLLTEAKSGGLIKKSELKIVMRELVRIEKRDGKLTPEIIVDEARDLTAPLHSFFTWNDGEAAELYRRWEARKLIASVAVVYDGAKERTAVRAFVSLTDADDERGYYGMARVLSDNELRSQMLADALAEVKQWRERYQHLEELAKIFHAIDGQ